MCVCVWCTGPNLVMVGIPLVQLSLTGLALNQGGGEVNLLLGRCGNDLQKAKNTQRHA